MLRDIPVVRGVASIPRERSHASASLSRQQVVENASVCYTSVDSNRHGCAPKDVPFSLVCDFSPRT